MRSYLALGAAALVTASPTPQLFDANTVAAIPVTLTRGAPVGDGPASVTGVYNQAAAIATAEAAASVATMSKPAFSPRCSPPSVSIQPSVSIPRLPKWSLIAHPGERIAGFSRRNSQWTRQPWTLAQARPSGSVAKVLVMSLHKRKSLSTSVEARHYSGFGAARYDTLVLIDFVALILYVSYVTPYDM
jgi:hypothetical protein